MQRSARAQARRKQIVEAAYKLFGEKGYHATSIADVADALSIGHGTVYRYFKDKRDVFEAVVDHVSARIRGSLSLYEPNTAQTFADLRVQLTQIATILIGTIMRDKHLQRIVFEEVPSVDRKLEERLKSAFQACTAVTERLVQHGMRRRFLRPTLDSELTALAINAVIFEGGRWMVRGNRSHREQVAWTDTLLPGLVLDGLRHRPGEHAR